MRWPAVTRVDERDLRWELDGLIPFLYHSAQEGRRPGGGAMAIPELVGSVRDALTVRRVYAEPYVSDGLVVIPAAAVAGGGGGGDGHDADGGAGEGGGFGWTMRPVGAYVIADGEVRWRPAIDVTRLASAAATVAVVALVVRLRLERSRR